MESLTVTAGAQERALHAGDGVRMHERAIRRALAWAACAIGSSIVRVLRACTGWVIQATLAGMYIHYAITARWVAWVGHGIPFGDLTCTTTMGRYSPHSVVVPPFCIIVSKSNWPQSSEEPIQCLTSI
jgi:hypothetical protein